MFYFFFSLPNVFCQDSWTEHIYSSRIWTTDDWYSYRQSDTNEKFNVLFDLPAGWSIRSSVLYDSLNKKIGEFMPGVIILHDDQKIPQTKNDYLETQNEDYDTFVDFDTFSFSKNSGVIIIEESVVRDEEGSYILWFPHEFIIQFEKYVLKIIFYSRDRIYSERDVFNEIINSIDISKQES